MRLRSFIMKCKGLKTLFFIPVIFLLILVPLAVNAIVSIYHLPEMAYAEVEKVLILSIPIVSVFWASLMFRDTVDGEIRELIYPFEIARRSQLPEMLLITFVYCAFTVPALVLTAVSIPGVVDIAALLVTMWVYVFFYNGICYLVLHLRGKTLAGIMVPILYYGLSVSLLQETPFALQQILSVYSWQQQLPAALVILAALYLLGFAADRKDRIKKQILKRASR